MSDVGHHQRTYKGARGSTRAKGSVSRLRQQLRIAVGFEPESFEEIRLYAVRENISMAEAIRRLVEWGMMSLDDE